MDKRTTKFSGGFVEIVVLENMRSVDFIVAENVMWWITKLVPDELEWQLEV